VHVPRNPDNRTIEERMADVEGINRVLAEARYVALVRARNAGVQVPVWHDNQIVWCDPQELLDLEPLSDPPTGFY